MHFHLSGMILEGLADTFAKMGMSFDSNEAEALNKDIFETIYYGSMKRSNELSKQRSMDMQRLQEEFVFDLFNNIPGYMKWFVPFFKGNQYNKELKYYEKVSVECNISKNITKIYHDCKPNMNEIFGISFYKLFQSYIVNQEKKYGDEYNNYEKMDEHMKNCVRRPKLHGAYSSFEGSPLSKGQFQFDLWNVVPSKKHDWDSLRDSILEYGVRNALCVAPMPTASTSQILANNECFEPFTSNIYSRRTLAGEFVVINKHLMKELKALGVWNNELKNEIIEQKGSIQKIESIPQETRQKYKIVWDMSMKRLINMAKARGAFICQSQSMNLWVEDPNYKNLTSMHFYAWRSGLKTGIYYLRRKAKHQAQQFTIEPKTNMNHSTNEEEEEDPPCEMCSG